MILGFDSINIMYYFDFCVLNQLYITRIYPSWSCVESFMYIVEFVNFILLRVILYTNIYKYNLYIYYTYDY